MRKYKSVIALMLIASSLMASTRERQLMDFGWKFSFGHPFDKTKYFNVGTSFFTYLANLNNGKKYHNLPLDFKKFKVGLNSMVVVAEPFVKAHEWDNVNTLLGNVQVILPAPQWHRKIFNGLAQVIVQSTGQKGKIVLKGNADGLSEAVMTIDASTVEKRHCVASVE